MITIAYYGVGNIGSLCNMLQLLGAEVQVATDPAQLADARKVILPGVGAFDAAMESMRRTGMDTAVVRFARETGRPVLGICLGMQLMTKGSEEGRLPGLGLVDATTELLRFAQPGVKVPHMGWNTILPRGGHPLCEGLDDQSRFYFAHSYYVRLERPDDTLFTTNYAGTEFTSAFARDNVCGVQFHPEKSHRFGKILLKRFIEL